jgi:glycosyltransferase involved in cell wall biosynthesis
MNSRRLRLCYVADLRTAHARRWIAFFARRGHSITVLTPPIGPDSFSLSADQATASRDAGQSSELTVHSGKMPDLEGVAVHRFLRKPGLPKLIQLTNVLPLKRILYSFRPDVLHAHYVRIYGWVAALSFFDPLVVTVWGGDILEDQGAFSDFLGRKLTPFSIKRARLVTAHSKFLRERVMELGKEGNRVRMVGCPGVDRKLFRPGLDTSALAQELGLGRNHLVLCTRLMGELYNTETVLRAVPLILKKVPDTKFLFSELMSHKPYIERMKALAVELGVVRSLLFLDGIHHERMPLFLNLAEAFVSVPDSDGMPQSLLEAMSCGTVPVVSDLPQYAGLIRNEENALVVVRKDSEALAEAVVKLLTDPTLRKRLSGASVNMSAACMDYETEMQKMEKHYYELAGCKLDGG